MRTQHVVIWLDVLYEDGFQEFIYYSKHFRGKQWHAYNRILDQAVRSLPDYSVYAVDSVSFS
jgi:hypothetical protein